MHKRAGRAGRESTRSCHVSLSKEGENRNQLVFFCRRVVCTKASGRFFWVEAMASETDELRAAETCVEMFFRSSIRRHCCKLERAKVLNCYGTGTLVINNLVLNPEPCTSKWWGESDVDRE